MHSYRVEVVGSPVSRWEGATSGCVSGRNAGARSAAWPRVVRQWRAARIIDVSNVRDIEMRSTLFVDGADDGSELAAVIVGDVNRVKTTTPFGQQIDLALHLAIRHGLTRMATIAALDDTVPLAGWTLTRDDTGIATVCHQGPEKYFFQGSLGDDQRWWTAAVERSHVKLLVLGDLDVVRHKHDGDDLLDDLNGAAARGLLVGGLIPFVSAGPRTVPASDVDPERLRLHGMSLTQRRGRFTLNISRPESGLTGTIELNQREAVDITTDLLKTFDANPGALVNISAIVREHTGRDIRPPV